MDRRIVTGIIGLILTGIAGSAPAQSVPVRDPSGQPGVGLGPIRSLNDSINNVELPANPIDVPLASNRVPTSPVGSGPAAAIPNPPVLNEPVSLTPIDPIHQSITHGFGTGRIAGLFRRPATRPIAAASTTPARFLPSYGDRPNPPTFTPLTPAPTDPIDRTSFPATAPAPAPAAVARPAPYSGTAPASPRPVGRPPTSPTGEGRPAPRAGEVPANPRLQSSAEPNPPVARPQLDPATTPHFRPVELPTTTAPASTLEPTMPIRLPAPPPLEAIPSPPPGLATPTTGAIEPPPAGLPVLEQVESSPASPTPPAATLATNDPAPVTDLPAAPTPRDDQVRRTTNDESAIKLKDSPTIKEQSYITFRAAAVGNEIITINELEEAVKRQMASEEMIQGVPPNSPEFRAIKNQVAAMMLNRMIEERLIIQEFRSKIAKNPKAEQGFTEFLDNIWRTEEVPALNNQYGTTNVHELRIKLREHGKDYDAMKIAFRKTQMAHQFLNGEIKNEVTCDLSEKKAYYTAHIKEFERPARITWREIEVNVSRFPDRASARKQADELDPYQKDNSPYTRQPDSDVRA